jgi:type I restriction enzyme S subunit
MRVALRDPTYRSATPKELTERLVKAGDLLLEKSGGGEKQPVGFVVLYEGNEPAICSNFTAKMELAKGMSPSFWRYVHAAGYSIRLNVPSIKQTSGIQNLDQNSYLDEKAAFPPAAEQQNIAAFLDHETARIDALIEEQRRLIELLKEKRQAVISRAVTKGLDPNVPMKDPGVEWLKEVPGHWQVTPLKRSINLLTSGSRGWAKHYSDDGAAFIRIGNLAREKISLDLSDLQYVSVPRGAEGERTRVLPGDVLFSITAYLGSVAVVPEGLGAAYVSQHVALVRLDSARILPEWVAYVALSNAGKAYLAAQGYGGTKIQLALEDVAGLVLPVPPLREQEDIVLDLSRRIRQLDELIKQAEEGIRILDERRSALISAAVTGKIDVRGWSADAGHEESELPMVADQYAGYSARGGAP